MEAIFCFWPFATVEAVPLHAGSEGRSFDSMWSPNGRHVGFA